MIGNKQKALWYIHKERDGLALREYSHIHFSMYVNRRARARDVCSARLGIAGQVSSLLELAGAGGGFLIGKEVAELPYEEVAYWCSDLPYHVYSLVQWNCLLI